LNHPGKNDPEQEHEQEDNYSKTCDKQQPVIKIEPDDRKRLKE
jgi:hypothetical protein